MTASKIYKVLSEYDEQQLQKLEDFLFTEIDDDTRQETIEFVRSSDEVKSEGFMDILYKGSGYEGLFIEGSQYLISSTENEVLIIDLASEEHGVDEKYTRYSMNIEDFIYLITEKEKMIVLIKTLKNK